MLCMSNSPKMLTLLLERAKCVRVTEKMLKSAVAEYGGAELLKLLLEHDPVVQIEPVVLVACAESEAAKCLELVLRQDPEIEIPEQVIVNVVRVGSKWGGGSGYPERTGHNTGGGGKKDCVHIISQRCHGGWVTGTSSMGSKR